MSEGQEKKACMKPCPICDKLMFIVGVDEKGKKLTSCGHRYSFRRTKSEKILDRKYKETPWGMELIK